jgi:hypothetical protein
MKNLTKRDVLFFVAGLLFVLIIEMICNWNDFKQGFLKGYNDGRATQEQTK